MGFAGAAIAAILRQWWGVVGDEVFCEARRGRLGGQPTPVKAAISRKREERKDTVLWSSTQIIPKIM